jgi:hypothetical protein
VTVSPCMVGLPLDEPVKSKAAQVIVEPLAATVAAIVQTGLMSRLAFDTLKNREIRPGARVGSASIRFAFAAERQALSELRGQPGERAASFKLCRAWQVCQRLHEDAEITRSGILTA